MARGQGEWPVASGWWLVTKCARSVKCISSLATSRQPLATTRRSAYSLVELLITISIIAIMASMVLFALFSAQEQAKVQKTRALIARLDGIIQSRYESYRTRRVQTNISVSPSDPNYVTAAARLARQRLDVLRDVMRMEMPDRWSDVYDSPIALPGMTNPSVSQAYVRKWMSVTGQTGMPVRDVSKEENQGAECLYMIVMEAVAQEGDARDVFKPDDVRDTDGDGFPEFVDAWGQPIQFFRWAPGFISDRQVAAQVTLNGNSVSANQYEATGVGPSRLSTAPGYYIGGTLAEIDSANKTIRGDRMLRITGYDITGGVPKFTCETPRYTAAPLGATPSTGNVTFAVMLPDPFDSRNVYPLYPPRGNVPVASFAIYPVIVSGGPDRAIGMANKYAAGLSYASQGLNPFWVEDPTNGYMVGAFPPDAGSEPNWKAGCWLDNIHNHQLSTR